MADNVRTGPRPHILNTDGQPHPFENAMAIFVLVAGLVSFVLGLIVRNAHTSPAAHIIATATGLAALFLQLMPACDPPPRFGLDACNQYLPGSPELTDNDATGVPKALRFFV